MSFVDFVWNGRARTALRTGTDNVARWGLFLLLTALVAGGCESAAEVEQEPMEVQVQAEAQSPPEPAQTPETAADEPESEAKPDFPVGEEVSLFDGQALGQWKPTDFGGQGDVVVKDGAMHLEMGSYMTGITWTGPVVRMNYEITLEAARIQGNDFFCGLTFPVGEKPCTLVLGGWGGSVCGLSTIDYFDASENQTTRIMSFEKGKWYHVRLRVVPDRIQAWLDGEELVDFDTRDHKIDIRIEVDLCQPLGVATWMTEGAVRNIKLKRLPEERPVF